MTVTYKACRVSFDEKRSNVNKKKHRTQNATCKIFQIWELLTSASCEGRGDIQKKGKLEDGDFRGEKN